LPWFAMEARGRGRVEHLAGRDEAPGCRCGAATACARADASTV
jgi:hypothetical protein